MQQTGRMDTDVVVLATVLVTILLAVVALTFLGARRRGQRWYVAVASGLLFPVAWLLWYVRDEHPYRAGHRRASRS